MIKKALSIFISIFIVLISLPAIAENVNAPIANVAAIEGSATITHSGGLTPLQAGTPIYLNDIVTTGDNARLSLLFIDNTELVLGEDSELLVDSYIFDPKQTDNKAHYSVLKGAFLFTTGLMGKQTPPNIDIDTAYGSIGIRGTVVWGGPKTPETYGVLVQEGQIVFTNDGGETVVDAGLGIDVANAATQPTEPKTWGDTAISNAVASISFKDAAAAQQQIQRLKDSRQP